MATYSVSTSKHAMLLLNIVDVVTLPDAYTVRVSNRGVGTALYFRIDGVDPTAAGDDCYRVDAGKALTIWTGAVITSVRLISVASQDYSVEALPVALGGGQSMFMG